MTDTPRSARTTAVDLARGAAIGVVETIPGVSGGTMALIVGVYERLIASAGHLVDVLRGGVSALRGRGTGRARESARAIDVRLLVTIGIGMLVALALASRVLPDVIAAHPVATRAVFFGMVAASVLVPVLALRRLRGVGEGLVIAGAAVAAWILTGLPSPTGGSAPPLWLVGIAAAVAVCALVLPGLSGSFLLLVLGLYEPTLRAVAEGDIAYIAVFVLGAVLGLGSFVRLLQWLLEHHRRTIMLIMAGLLIGALRALWPWQDEGRTLLAPDPAWAAMVPLALAGAVVVTAMVWAQHRWGADPDTVPRTDGRTDDHGADTEILPVTRSS